jgi:SAM-dependent methyltransferase
VSDYRDFNRANWDDRVPAHLASPDYDVERFTADPVFISDVVRFDQALLGDVAGLRGVHLQCHIGTDTISLARLGASMTGLDFSAPAVEAATALAARTGADARFVTSDVYAATEVLEPGSFDLVYTGVGALPWLPSVRRWAQVAAALLRPGGRLFIREGHPALQAFEVRDGRLSLEYPYFEQPEPMVWDEDITYVQTDARMAHTVTHQWSHGIGETVTALLDADLRITGLTEHDTIPWNALPDLMEPVTPRPMAGSEWRLADNPQRLPHSFTLQAVRDEECEVRRPGAPR